MKRHVPLQGFGTNSWVPKPRNHVFVLSFSGSGKPNGKLLTDTRQKRANPAFTGLSRAALSGHEPGDRKLQPQPQAQQHRCQHQAFPPRHGRGPPGRRPRSRSPKAAAEQAKARSAPSSLRQKLVSMKLNQQQHVWRQLLSRKAEIVGWPCTLNGRSFLLSAGLVCFFLAEGAMAVQVTLGGGELLASGKLLQFQSSLIVRSVRAIVARASAQPP